MSNLPDGVTDAEISKAGEAGQPSDEAICERAFKDVGLRQDDDKKWWLLFVVTFLSALAGLTGGGIYLSYGYDVKMGQYIRLADDASTAEAKLGYLQKYQEAVEQNIVRNQARFIFQKERLTRDRQLSILSTLKVRLQDAANMNQSSFEYQTAMNQITGQEFNHALGELSRIISDCWLRQSALAVFGLWFAWIPLAVVVITRM